MIVLTAAAIVQCPHQGRVTIAPAQQTLRIAGSPALVSGDLGPSRSILGCLNLDNSQTGTKTCRTVTTATGSLSGKLTVHGRAVLLSSPPGGMTDGVPVGMVLTIVSTGQQKLTAS